MQFIWWKKWVERAGIFSVPKRKKDKIMIRRVNRQDKEKQKGVFWTRVILITAVLLTEVLLITGCGAKNPGNSGEQTEITVLAAASLQEVCEEIKIRYEKENPQVKVYFSYGGSGALQTQIEEGAPADVFISAALKQMNALQEQELMVSDSVVELLENKVVLIAPKDSDLSLDSFEAVAGEQVAMIGLGEPESVPAGQYAEEIFTSLGIWETVKARANYGSDVRTVLTWVENEEVDCGIVYATDAYSSEQVKILCEAPEGACQKVIYPAGVIKASKRQGEAKAFITYLQTEEIINLFETYGFSGL